MRNGDAHYYCQGVKVRLPLCSTLLTESSEEKIRHPATLLALSETGGKFSSGKRVIPGERIAVILHPDVRYAIRGRVTWTRPTEDEGYMNFGVTFEEGIPDSLWDILRQARVA